MQHLAKITVTNKYINLHIHGCLHTNTGWAKNCTFSIRHIDGTVQDKMVFTKMFREDKRPNTRWKARVKFLLSVIELLFLSLAVEALQGKMCQNSLPSGGGRSLGAKISGTRGHPPANIFIPIERRLIALQRWHCLYNETLQQNFRPVLSKLSKRQQI